MSTRVTVTISGPGKSGKSSIYFLVQEALNAAGVKVGQDEDENEDEDLVGGLRRKADAYEHLQALQSEDGAEIVLEVRETPLPNKSPAAFAELVSSNTAGPNGADYGQYRKHVLNFLLEVVEHPGTTDGLRRNAVNLMRASLPEIG